MRKRMLCAALCLCLLLSLCACARKEMSAPDAEPEVQEEAIYTLPELSPEAEPDAASAQALLEYLTSPQLAGRAVGSDGNVRTAHDLAALLQGLGYAPFAEKYCIPYTDRLVRQESAEASLTLVSADGTRTDLTAGADYIYYPVYETIDVSLSLSGDKETAAAREAIYCGEAADARAFVIGQPEAIAFACGDLDAQITLNNNLEQDRGAYFLLDERFGELLSQEGVRAELHLGACAEVGQALNVVAVRRGSSGRTALVIGAHFDGSGFCGNAYYPSAYDNASGTTAMIMAAWLLANAELKSDLIFAAFNGEETGLNGSAALAETLCEGYDSVTVLNLDCMGLAADDGYTISGGEYAFSDFAKTLDNFAPCETQMPSDHLSFDEIETALATNLADKDAMKYMTSLMHTRGDTADKLSAERVLRAAQLVAAYVEQENYPRRWSENEDMQLLYEIPYHLMPYAGMDEAFVQALSPDGSGASFEQTYDTWEALEAETGLHVLRTDTPLAEGGIYLSIWSSDSENGNAYSVDGFCGAQTEDVYVSQEFQLFLGQEIESAIRAMGNEAVEVTTETYALEEIGAEATIYQIKHTSGETDVVGAFIADNILYICEADGVPEDPTGWMQRFLEQYRA